MKRASGMRASSFLHFQHNEKKQVKETERRALHLPFVFLFTVVPFLSLVYFPFIEKEQRRAFFALCLSSIKGKGNKEPKLKRNEQR